MFKPFKIGLNRVLYPFIPLAILLAVSILACLLGYFLNPLVGDHFPLSKVVSKTTLFFLVLSIFPAMAWLGLKAKDLGFAPRKTLLKQIVLGFGIGLLTLLPVLIAEYLLGIRELDPAKAWTAAFLLKKSGSILLVALLISSIEEPLFRGLLISALGKKMPLATAIGISAVYYASLHFLHSHTLIPSAEVEWDSGFLLLAEAFGNLFAPANFSAWVALLMVGLFLGILRARAPDHLGYCIGCHTAWVWQIKLSKTLFNTHFDGEYGFLVSRYDGVIGWLVAGWLALFLAGYAFRRAFAASR